MKDLDTVEVKPYVDMNGRNCMTIETPKRKASFIIKPGDNDNRYYQVFLTSGASPVYGLFTSIEAAKKEVLTYIRNTKESKAVHRDDMVNRREKQRAERKAKVSGS